MRHPNSGLSEDDLSRLTGTSSSASCGNNSSASSSSSAACIPSESINDVHTPSHIDSYKSASLEIIKTPEKISLKNSIHTQNSITTTQSTTTLNNKTYLPDIINPLEWQKSRKRKDRLDSTSSAILDRKLQRSNSEDQIPPPTDNCIQQIDKPEEKEGRKEKEEEKEQDENACPEHQLNQQVGNSGGGNVIKSSTPSDAIRRVSSEDFKKRISSPTHTQSQEDNNKIYRQVHSSENIHEKNSSWGNLQNVAIKQSQQQQPQQQQQQQQQQQHSHHQQQQNHQKEKPFSLECFIGSSYSCPTKDMTRRARQETSPARSHHLSPIRNNNNHNGNKYRDSDDSECEHERRRSSERFCKSRAPPGRKASGVTKKSQSSKYFPTKLHDENAYKYDLSALKYERRGFISKKVYQGDKSSNGSTPTSDHNDNNLIDFHEQQQQLEQQQQKSADPSPTVSGEAATVDEKSSNILANSSNSTPTTPTETTQSILKKPRAYSVPPITSAQDALPWGRSVPEDQAPILSRRYATVRHHPGDNIDTAAKLSKVSPYPQQFHKQNSAAQQLVDELYDAIEPLNIYKGFSSLTSLRASEVMAQVIPAMMNFQSPEERLNQVNKRMSVLKKKLAQLEQSFETRLGYRPSEAERLNDKQMKNVISELGKLRKERHELKSDPMAAMGLKVRGGDSSKKLEKMKITLLEIEENLATKRTESERAETLDLLNTDQLVQEKTAVQHGLLYFESLYGRPSTKDERDAARPLYDRYRQLKRMVSRTVLISGNSNVGIPELPTILENEAMVFESTPPQQYSSNNSSSDSNNTPSDSLPPNSISNSTASDESTTTTTTTTTTNPNPQKSRAFDRLPIDEVAYNRNVSPNRRLSTSENIGLMSIDQLWVHLEKTSEEKKLLKRSIREYETAFEEQNGRKMLKSDRKMIEETYAQYKEKKAKARLLQALIKKQIQR